jgi:hypothetical protein
MDDMTRDAPQQAEDNLLEYSSPEVTDYGSLQELTAAHLHGGQTDVPKGSPAPAVFC